MVETTVHREGSGAWVSQATIPCKSQYISIDAKQSTAYENEFQLRSLYVLFSEQCNLSRVTKC